jgi:hypothetical protein
LIEFAPPRQLNRYVAEPMYRKLLTIHLSALLLSVTSSNAAGQSLRPDLEKVSRAVETYFEKNRLDWRHETALPPTPPGGQPSPDVAIHFWSSEKCVTAELVIDGVNVGKHPVSCRIKLAIDQSPSASDARARLTNFVRDERSASPISAGDKGYIWRGGDVVFVKGKFTFWLSGGLDLRVGDFTSNPDFMVKLAKEIADAAPAT